MNCDRHQVTSLQQLQVILSEPRPSSTRNLITPKRGVYLLLGEQPGNRWSTYVGRSNDIEWRAKQHLNLVNNVRSSLKIYAQTIHRFLAQANWRVSVFHLLVYKETRLTHVQGQIFNTIHETLLTSPFQSISVESIESTNSSPDHPPRVKSSRLLARAVTKDLLPFLKSNKPVFPGKCNFSTEEIRRNICVACKTKKSSSWHNTALSIPGQKVHNSDDET